MNIRSRTYDLTMAALLCALGIVIPMISPVKIIVPPASFTLASHVPIFLAMFISPLTAAFVALGTTLGFVLAGFPFVIVLRAATHIVFATVGAVMIAKRPELINSGFKALFFSLGIGVLHALCEVAAVTPLYLGNAMDAGFYASGYAVSVLLLVGVGTVAHSMIDFYLSLILWRGAVRIRKNRKDAR